MIMNYDLYNIIISYIKEKDNNDSDYVLILFGRWIGRVYSKYDLYTLIYLMELD